MKIFLTILLLNLTLLSCEQVIDTANKTIIYSHNVKDSFEIYISQPPGIDTNKVYNVFYYCDANLKSGKKLKELITKSDYAIKASNTIFVGFVHMGNYHILRRRDFILPEIHNGDTAGISVNYGQIENFYRFLKLELIPKINSTYKTNQNHNSILGHSLGGLFVFYCLFKNDTLFKNYYALSPSLWVDNYSIYHFNKLTKENRNEKNLYFSAGGMEIFNHIKKGANRMEVFLKDKKYQNLKFEYSIHPGKTHNSQVEKSLDHILKQK